MKNHSLLKRLPLLIWLVLCAWGAFAQPAFTGSNYPSVGAGVNDSFKLGSLPTIYTFMEDSTGNSYTWDFVHNFDFTPPSAVDYFFVTPNPANYTYFPPGSNLREASNLQSVDNLYEKKTDTLYMTWAGTSLSTGATMIPKIRWLTYPLNFNDSLGTTQLEYTSLAMTTPAIKRTHSYKYDGYGTVKLPWNTYNDVYRIKSYTRDSSVAVNTVITYSEYDWYTSNGTPLVRMVSTSIGDSVSHIYGLTANKNAHPTAIKNVLRNDQVNIYPNPAQHVLYVTNTSGKPLQMCISDMQGRMLKNQLLNTAEEAVDVAVLPAGCYSIKLQSIDGRQLSNKTFIKQ